MNQTLTANERSIKILWGIRRGNENFTSARSPFNHIEVTDNSRFRCAFAGERIQSKYLASRGRRPEGGTILACFEVFPG